MLLLVTFIRVSAQNRIFATLLSFGIEFLTILVQRNSVIALCIVYRFKCSK